MQGFQDFRVFGMFVGLGCSGVAATLDVSNEAARG